MANESRPNAQLGFFQQLTGFDGRQRCAMESNNTPDLIYMCWRMITPLGSTTKVLAPHRISDVGFRALSVALHEPPGFGLGRLCVLLHPNRGPGHIDCGLPLGHGEQLWNTNRGVPPYVAACSYLKRKVEAWKQMGDKVLLFQQPLHL